MNDFKLEVFKNEKFGEIRVLEVNNIIWFVGKDIAESLGYSNTKKAIADHIDFEDKIMGEQNVTPYITDSLGRKQYPTLINESGIYSLVFGSKLKQAKEFKKWVTKEVLPAIRKTGIYMTDSVWNNLMNDPTKFGEMLIEYGKVREENKRLNKTIEEQAPKVEYTEKVLASDNLLTVTQIAKDFGLSARKLNSILSNEKIQFKQGKQWFLYQEYADKGYTKSFTTVDEDGKVYVNTKWTQKGKQFIYDLLIELGYEIVEGK